MRTFLVTFWLLFVVAACDSQITDTVDRELARISLEVDKECAKGQCPCSTPLGPIAHGSKVTTFSQSTVQCNEGCGKYASELICRNGDLLEESTQQKADLTNRSFKCTVLECPSCRLGENLIRNTESIIAYNTNQVGCRQSCEDAKQVRICEMGTLSGDSNFQFTQCTRRECRCELPNSSSFLSLDGKVKLYSLEMATCGQTCKDFELERTCIEQPGGTGFVLSGSSAFRFGSCTEPTNCSCRLPGTLGVLQHGETRRVWNAASVACGLSCETVPSITVRCENGVFRNQAAPTEIIDFTSSTYTNFRHECRVQDCVSCPVPGTALRIPHGDSYNFFRASSASCAEGCSSRQRQCVNGQFSGDAAFSASSCTVRRCDCDVPGEQSLKIPIGSTWRFYSAAVPQCGSSCNQISELKTCTEVAGANNTYSYIFVGSAAHTAPRCTEPQNCECALPGGLGSIEDKKSVVLTSESVVPCGKACNEIPNITAVCANGLLFREEDRSLINPADTTYPYKYFCNQATCQACPLPGFGSIANGNKITLYSKAVMTCSDDPVAHTFLFSCENGKLLRNSVAYNPDQDPNRPAAWHTSYTVNCPGCTLPWGGFVAEGRSVTAYKFFGTVSNLSCGRGCKSSERTCTKGVLDGDPTYNLSTCDNSCITEGGGAPPRMCLLPYQNAAVTPDSQVTLYSRRTVPCGESCTSHQILARCDMKTGVFTNATWDHLYPQCTELCPD